jgi:hypothetical protein
MIAISTPVDIPPEELPDEDPVLRPPVAPTVPVPTEDPEVVGVDDSAGGGVGGVGAATDAVVAEATLVTVGAATVSDCADAAVATLVESCDWMVEVEAAAVLAEAAFVDVDGILAVNEMVAARRADAVEVTEQPVSQA